MDLSCRDAKDLPCPTRYPGKQFGRVVRIQPIQRATQTVIIEHVSADPWPQQVFDGFVGEELRHQIQLSIAEP